MQKAYVLLGVAATVLQLAATPQRRRELYVSPSGNPGGDGTLMKPFATIGGCIDYATRVATGAATGSPADAACVLSPGKYHEEVVVGPGPELRGPETSHVGSVSVIGAPGVELTGTASVPATLWRRCDGGTQPVYCAVLPPNLRPRGGEGALQQVFVQGTMTFEARWPNTNLTEVGAARSWATTTNSTAPVLDLNTSVQISDGMIWSDALAATGVDFTGALLTLQAGTRVWTWTRTVKAHAAGSPILRYDGALIPEKGGPSELENLFFLSGVLGALDSPNEWLYNPVTHTLRIWMPDGDPPAGRVAVKTHDLCVSNLAQSERKTLPVHVANLSFFGCTFALNDCDGCTVRDVTATYPSYSRTVPFRDVPIPGKPPNVTLVEGNDTVVERVALRFSNVAGLLMIGSRVMVNEVLLEDFDWLGSLDFPPLQIGFGRMVCPLHAIHFDPSTCGHMMRLSAPPPRRLRHPHGDRARVNRVTVRHAGGCGIVASQLSHEISFSDVSLATTVGLDQAGLHIDNLDAHTNTLCDQNNCSKTWHHNWVHDIRDKCARGDDGTVDLSFHHNVVFNCGGAPGTYVWSLFRFKSVLVIFSSFHARHAVARYVIGATDPWRETAACI